MSCIVCNNVLEYGESKICGDDDCEFKSRSLYLEDNYVYDYIKNNEKEALFLLTSIKWAGDDISPLPYFDNMNKQSIQASITSIFKDLKIDNEIQNILFMMTDSIIFDSYGPFKYGVYKFILKSNLISFKNNNMFTLKNVYTYEVSHYKYNVAMFNNKIKKNGSCYLFHGSTLKNWYSIMMNGLKVFSNTPRMANGAAHGPGIYLSNDLSVSQGYATKQHFDITNNYNYVVGVFEVVGKEETYGKNNIFVVPDEKLLCLKYIIWNNKKSLSREEIYTISNKFTKSLVDETKDKNKYYTNMRNKRLLVEYNKVMKLDSSQTGIKFEINEENMFIWKLYLTKIDENSRLSKDMKKLNIQHIELEIRFDQQFPISPPFVRIVSPIFKYRTGHITLGGSICMELLTNDGWSPAYSIENLIIHIKSLILEGEGEIDEKKIHMIYTYEESQTAFKRMLQAHGWH